MNKFKFNFTLDDLRMFIAAYECGSISKAAAELYTTRQAVSRGVANLERTMGHELFVRGVDGVRRTDFAPELYERATRTLAAAQEVADYPEIFSRKSTHISFGIMGHYSMGQYIISAINVFCKKNREYDVNIAYYEWPDILTAVEERQIDCAYTVLSSTRIPDTLVEMEVTQNPFVIVTNSDDDIPTTSDGSVSAKWLEGRQIILMTRNAIQLGIIEKYASDNGLHFTEPITTSDLFLIEEYIRERKGVVILEEYVAKNLMLTQSGLRRYFIDPPFVRHSGIIYSSEKALSREQLKLFTFLKKQIAERD